MKTEINKTYGDISVALTSGCSWNGDNIVSNVTVFFDLLDEEKTIQLVQRMGDALFVKVVDEEDMTELTANDIVYQTT